jgi:hypothetical protein
MHQINPSSLRPWLMLFSRLVLFAGLQAVFALGYFLTGSPKSWEASADWWPFVITLANLAGFILLLSLFRAEGRRYWEIFRIQREHVKGDLPALLGILVIAGPVSMLPNILLGQWLFGDSQATLPLVFRPLPLWAACIGSFLFPITQGLAEIPTYFGYVMPRFESQGMRPWLAVTLPALLLGLQHIALPLLFDAEYVIWRGLMFMPFAFLVGIVLHWRPRLLPYLVIVHVLMDLLLAPMFIGAAY